MLLGFMLLVCVCVVLGVSAARRWYRNWSQWPKHDCDCKLCRKALVHCVCVLCVSARSRVRMRAARERPRT
jgi:hypothetical protein